MMRREWLDKLWRPETGIFLVIWLTLMFAGRTRLFRDPGTFWHTAVGERMLSQQECVRADPYTYTFHGEPWIAHQWLGECVMALLYRLGDLDTLLLATATLLAFVYAWLAHRLIRTGVHWSLTAVFLALVIASSSYHFHVRPHIATLVLMALLFGRLADFESERISLRGLLWLVPLVALWTNIHGGTLGGLATLALVVAGWLGAWLLSKESPLKSGRQALGLLAVAVACGLAVLINPYGPDMLRAWLQIMAADLPDMIEEHAPLDLGSWESWCLILLANVYVFVLLGTLPRWPRATWLIPLVWFVLACGRIRHGPLFALTAGVAVAEMFPHTRWASWLVRKGSDWFQPANVPRVCGFWPLLLPMGLVLVALVLQASRTPMLVLGHGWVELDPAAWPVELAPELQALGRVEGTRLFNEFSFGGFLILYAPALPVFIDDRCELFLADDFLKSYAAAGAGEMQVLDRWEKRYRFSHALTSPGSAFDRYFAGSADWRFRKGSLAANLYDRRE